ncbi:DUF465 domain-containing protein [Sphingomonas jatrophae]|uniref:DUF465 domain-containing protein n=1 Tax=Sphingomonas jatrophae TaxID=1166337 RepID=A0A1I6JHX8_9SPHN|nr:DUF465 domain-containing protein [Sphingomonas jatrophae]SFR78626.1 hypothetical protein SAMN05192580_0301 [Sphingomonas jatrophae]
MVDSHANALVNKHAGLDARLAEEIRRPNPDSGLVAELKKQKLKLKDMLRN